jgi:hypothetical protein
MRLYPPDTDVLDVPVHVLYIKCITDTVLEWTPRPTPLLKLCLAGAADDK